jgi:hypothetical protein
MLKNIKSWWLKWFGTGTADDWRNPFWRWTESKSVTVVESWTTSDTRIGFRDRSGKWRWIRRRARILWIPNTDANFYNAIFAFNRTKTLDTKGKWHKRFNLVIRPCNAFWFAWGVGILPDRGEWGWTGPVIHTYKSQLEHNPGCIARAWDEGSI